MRHSDLVGILVILFFSSVASAQNATMFGSAETYTRTPPATTYVGVANGSDYSEGQDLKAKWIVDYDNRGNQNAASFRATMQIWDSYYETDKEEADIVTLLPGSRVFTSHDIGCSAGDPETTLMYNTWLVVEINIGGPNPWLFCFDDGTPYWEATEVY